MPLIPIQDGELFYVDEGDGRPVVLLHAGLMDHSMWDEQAAFLAPNYRVIRYDARGHGQSSTPESDYSHAEDLHQLLVELDIDRASFVGLSLGARTAIDFALLYPEIVEALVLAGPGISGMEMHDPVILAYYAKQMEAAQARDADAFVEWSLRSWVDGPEREPDEVDPGVRARCRDMALASIRAHHTASGALKELRAIDRLAEIEAPVLGIYGDLDAKDIVVNIDRLKAALPGTNTVVIRGAGHMVNMEAPEAFNAALADFLGTH